MKRAWCRGALLCAGLAALAGSARAQDSHYWTLQHGNRARLLGGAVVGSVSDLSAVFYNPGRLGFSERNELVLAGNVLQVTRIAVENPLGGSRQLTTTRLGGVPSLFAGELRFGFLGSHRLAYAFLERHDLDVRLETRGDIDPARLGLPASVQQVAANLGFESRMTDYWAGLTWAMPMGERLGIGVSQFVSVRSHRKRASSLLQARADTGGGVALLQDDFDYQHWGLVWKLGVGAQLEPWRFGVTVTTPTVGLFGSGKVGYDETVVATDLDGDGSSAASVLSDFQDGLPVTWKSPPSVAVGAAYSRHGTTRLHASLEWFGATGTYAVLDAEPISVDGGTESKSTDVIADFGSVVNFGVGLEQRISSKFDGLASFRTDQSATPQGSEGNVSITRWNLYHIAAGARFEVAMASFTFGAVYAFGSQALARQAPPPEGVFPPEEESTLRSRMRRLTFILGFEFNSN